MTQELTVIEESKAVQAFNAGTIEALVTEVENIARSIVLDASTAKGRDEIKSIAYKVAQSKSLIDATGKAIVSEWKEKAKVIDNARNLARTRLDALKDEIRRPVTEFEEREKARVSAHEAVISGFAEIASAPYDKTAEAEAAFSALSNADTSKLEEFASRGASAKVEAMEALGKRIAAMKKSDEDRAELERLRKENEERDRADRERKIAEAAAQKAREEAEAKAMAEQARAEAERQKVIREREEAEARARKAEEDAKAAVEAERRRIEEEAQKAREEEERRAADVEHQRKINREIMEDIIALGASEETAKDIIRAIRAGTIRNVKIVN